MIRVHDDTGVPVTLVFRLEKCEQRVEPVIGESGIRSVITIIDITVRIKRKILKTLSPQQIYIVHTQAIGLIAYT